MLKITLPSGAIHLIEAIERLDQYTSSLNTRAALQAAYDAGDWEHYIPPEPETEIEPPDWSEFRLALMMHPGFRAWAATLPADWREDLKMAALVASAAALQGIYDQLTTAYPPTPTAAAEWQAIADANHIPVSFE